MATKKSQNSIRRQNPFVNIWKIFIEDQRHLLRNVIGLVVVMGLVIVPAMYAWFNIAASWDPYGNTNQLKVAVANEDEGYESDLIPVPISIGNNVEASLRANTKLNWQFVSKDKAIDGVSSGDYYAAIVIPKNFSTMMMTVLSSNAQQAKIEYYINEKSNAIAPRITEGAADTIVSQVSSTFSQTIATVALNLAGKVNDLANSDEGKEYVSTMVNRLNTVADDLDTAGSQLSSYATLLQSSAGLVNSSKDIIAQSTQSSQDVREALSDTVSHVRTLADAAKTSSSSVTTALESAASSLDSVINQLDTLTSSVSTPAGDLGTRINALGTAMANSANQYRPLADALNLVKSNVNSSALSQATKDQITSAIDSVINQLNQASSDVATIGTHISSASQDVSNAQKVIADQKSELKKQIESVKSTLVRVKASYDSDIKPRLDQVAQQLGACTQCISFCPSHYAALGVSGGDSCGNG